MDNDSSQDVSNDTIGNVDVCKKDDIDDVPSHALFTTNELVSLKLRNIIKVLGPSCCPK